MADVGTGITIEFATSTFTAEINDVTPPASSRGSIQTSHMGTTGAHTHKPLTLVENGECEFEINFDAETAPPIDQDPEQVTITFPSGATWAFEGFMTNYAPTTPFEGKMIATVTVKVSGAITITAAA